MVHLNDRIPGFPTLRYHGGGNLIPGAIFITEAISDKMSRDILGKSFARVKSGAWAADRTIEGTKHTFICHPSLSKEIRVSPPLSISAEQVRVLGSLLDRKMRGDFSHMKSTQLAFLFREKVSSVSAKKNPGKRWVNIDPLMAEIIMDWHGGQWSTEYSVGSRYHAGMYTWDVSGSRTLMRLSEDEISMIKGVAAQEAKSYAKKRKLTSSEEDRLRAAEEVLYEGSLDDIGEGPEKD